MSTRGTVIQAINRGFSKQSSYYDEADRSNLILQDLRKQVYKSLDALLKPNSRILELNSGTGIDALHFTSHGHHVHATDVSDGMIAEIKRKISLQPKPCRLTCEQISYDQLEKLEQANFDLVFSNFGGLNCTKDLKSIGKDLPSLLKPQAHVVWVVMPRICPWELMWALKGKPVQALRRLKKGGVSAHVEGEYFQTYYHSVDDIRSALGSRFKFIRSQSLALVSPPPHSARLVDKYPQLYRWLRRADAVARDLYPLNRWGDHVMVTFAFKG